MHHKQRATRDSTLAARHAPHDLSVQHPSASCNRKTTRCIPSTCCNTQHATRNTPWVRYNKHHTIQGCNVQHAACNAQQHLVQHRPSHWPRRQMSGNLQNTTCNPKATCPHTMQHQTRASCPAHVATNTKHDARYNAPLPPHATPCDTHNGQRRGSRTALEPAMLPPLNSTDPPTIITTPPLCTQPPHSASDPIGLRCHAYGCCGIRDRHRLEQRLAAGHA